MKNIHKGKSKHAESLSKSEIIAKRHEEREWVKNYEITKKFLREMRTPVDFLKRPEGGFEMVELLEE